jgi:hypothetical protein
MMKAKHRWRLTGGTGCFVRTISVTEWERFQATGLMPDVGALTGVDAGLGAMAAHYTATEST